MSIEAILDDFRSLLKEKEAVEKDLERLFAKPVWAAFAEGRAAEAMALVASLSAESMTGAALQTRIVEQNLWDFRQTPWSRIRPANLTGEQEEARAAFDDIRVRHRDGLNVLSRAVGSHVRMLLDTEGVDAVKAFAKTVPSPSVRADLADLIRQREQVPVAEDGDTTPTIRM